MCIGVVRCTSDLIWMEELVCGVCVCVAVCTHVWDNMSLLKVGLDLRGYGCALCTGRLCSWCQQTSEYRGVQPGEGQD